MRRFGYARVSSTDQDLTVQREALEVFGCDIIREEKVSGKSRDGREQLSILLDFMSKGDVLVVTKLDRLARSLPDLFKIVETLEKKGAQLVVLNNSAINTTNPMGRCVFAIFGAIAELERDLIRERQADGIALAKKQGRYRGGKQRFDPEAIRAMKAAGARPAHIARQLKCSAATVFRALTSR